MISGPFSATAYTLVCIFPLGISGNSSRRQRPRLGRVVLLEELLHRAAGTWITSCAGDAVADLEAEHMNLIKSFRPEPSRGVRK
jgi:hypothetical protein